MNTRILMTTYNCYNYIGQAIKSILNQTYKDFELLIIDDGSIDNTEEIISQFKDNRIRYIKRQHSGMGASLNFGLMNASNDFIALMDADDISDTNRLERQLKCHSKNPNEIIFTSAAFFKSKKILFTGDTKVNAPKFTSQLALHGPYNNATAFFGLKHKTKDDSIWQHTL